MFLLFYAPWPILISMLQQIFPLPVWMESAGSLRQSFIHHLQLLEIKLYHTHLHTATNTTISIPYSTRPNQSISYIVMKLSLIHRKQHSYRDDELSFSFLLHIAAFVHQTHVSKADRHNATQTQTVTGEILQF